MTLPNDTIAPNFALMSDAEALEFCGDNAMRWAEFFCQVQKGHNFPKLDEGVMVGWFANAIEASWTKRSASAYRALPPALERETIQTLLDLLNPLHGSLDEQVYEQFTDERELDAPPDREYGVNVTAQQERDLTQAVKILENRLRDPQYVDQPTIAMASEWRTIDTAPRTPLDKYGYGPTVFLFADGAATGYWDRDHSNFYMEGRDSLNPQPSHWMAIPALTSGKTIGKWL